MVVSKQCKVGTPCGSACINKNYTCSACGQPEEEESEEEPETCEPCEEYYIGHAGYDYSAGRWRDDNGRFTSRP